jgi:hypothetical protein
VKKFSKLRFSWMMTTTWLMYWLLGDPLCGSSRVKTTAVPPEEEHPAGTMRPRNARKSKRCADMLPPNTVSLVKGAAAFLADS